LWPRYALQIQSMYMVLLCLQQEGYSGSSGSSGRHYFGSSQIDAREIGKPVAPMPFRHRVKLKEIPENTLVMPSK